LKKLSLYIFISYAIPLKDGLIEVSHKSIPFTQNTKFIHGEINTQ